MTITGSLQVRMPKKAVLGRQKRHIVARKHVFWRTLHQIHVVILADGEKKNSKLFYLLHSRRHGVTWLHGVLGDCWVINNISV